MKKSVLVAGAFMALMLLGCEKNNENFIVNTSQDVELINNVETATSAIKIDTSKDGDASISGISTSVDPSQRIASLHFSDELTPGSLEEDDFKIDLNGVKVGLAEDFTANSTKVGEARIEKSKACLEAGYDTDYYYDDDQLVVYTLVNGDKQLVFDIEIRDSKYKTSKGATVGESTRDDLYEMYGMPTDYSNATFQYTMDDGGFSLDFSFDADGILESIDIIDYSVM